MSAEVQTINIAEQFSPYPAGRYRAVVGDKRDGHFTGEKFREEYLVPGLRKCGVKLKVDFSGVRSCGSSFLEEAFGGLVREAGFREADLKTRLEIVGADDLDRVEIWKCIHEAEEAIGKK